MFSSKAQFSEKKSDCQKSNFLLTEMSYLKPPHKLSHRFLRKTKSSYKIEIPSPRDKNIRRSNNNL